MNHTGFPAASRLSLWIAFLTFSTLTCWSGIPLHAQSANNLYKAGHAAESREDFDSAYQNYQKAYAKDPKDLRYRTAMYRVQPTAAAQHVSKGRKLEQSGDLQGALTEFLRAGEIDPGNEAVVQEINVIRLRMGQPAGNNSALSTEETAGQEELKSIGSPVELKPVTSEPLTLHMTEDSKNVYQAIGRAAGINVLFDPDYTSKRIQVDLTNSTLMDGLRIVGVLSNTFWRPITPNTIFVAQNSRSKRTDFDEQAVQTFYLGNAWQQNDLNDVTTALRNVLLNIKVYGVASQNALVVRGTPDELLLAQKLIGDLDRARPEVVVDIAIMEVSKNWERNIGLSLPTSASVQLQSPTTSTTGTTGTTGTTTPSTNGLTLYNLAHLNSNDFAVTIGSATANLLLTDSNTRVLQNPRLRATDAQKATMKIGERIPIATGSYQTGAATALVSSLVNTQFQYIDIGVNIEMTPTIHIGGDVTLKMHIEDTSEGSPVTISGVQEPIIIQKTSEQTIRLREGEVSILGGILEQQDVMSWSGIPGLSSIPILRYLFGSKDHTITNDELVFMVIPHVIRSQSLTALNRQPVDTGSGQNVELRRLPVEGRAAYSPPQVQVGNAETVIGTYKAPTAAAAAPAALADLQNAAAGRAPASVPPPVVQPGSPGPTPAGQSPTPPPAVPGVSPSSTPGQTTPNANQGAVRLMLNPPGPVKNGATFQIPVVISGAADVAAVPVQMQYDPAKLSLVNVGPGDFLSRDGQSVGETHRDDGPGTVTLNLSRPRGASGVSGAGVVCVLTFQAKTAGDTNLSITRAGATTGSGQAVTVQGSQVSVNIQ
jgi:general secretion pathway protein D